MKEIREASLKTKQVAVLELLKSLFVVWPLTVRVTHLLKFSLVISGKSYNQHSFPFIGSSSISCDTTRSTVTFFVFFKQH